MKMVVAYASRYGSTKEIAEFIAEHLRQDGVSAEARSVETVSNPEDYHALVVGSAVYMQHWMDSAVEFVHRHHAVLAERPVWLFSSGPLQLSPELVAKNNLDVIPKEIPGLQEVLKPRDHRVFFGVLDPKKLSFKHWALRKLPAARPLFPEGDFRKWDEIKSWTAEIAQATSKGRSVSGKGA
jgi:menaquinone-dependent protoporphyrinogen oxidase